MNEENRKKRGCNYTPSEKDMLIEIVKGHLEILENKATSSHFIKKKQETWQLVTDQFNLVATSGPRTWLQLRHLYENIKQKSKKNGQTENRPQYSLKDLKARAAEDKVMKYLVHIEGNPVDLKNVHISKLIQNGPDTIGTAEIKKELDMPESSEPRGTEESVISASAKTNTEEQYFKIKLGNAKLERKYLIQKQKLEMQLLKLKIKRLTQRK